MSVEHLEVLVEELSMEAALRELLPRILGNVSFEIYSHQGKADLLARLPERLRGYRHWLDPNWRILVVVDRDDDDCLTLKSRMEQCATSAGLITRSIAGTGVYSVVNRIAIEELESWYFGDWDAVRAAYPRVASNVPSKAQFRRPDSIAGGTWEAFERVAQKAGYFKGGLRKVEAARAVAAQMEPSRNTSPSFAALHSVLVEMVS